MLTAFLTRYTHWLHTRWPAGVVEKLPLVHEDGTCAVPGVRIVGDLTGIPLLKFAIDGGAKAAQAVATELATSGASKEPATHDLAIIGGGVAGIAAAIEARARGLDFVLFEPSGPFFTIANFPKGKPIYTYPTGMTPAGSFQITAADKESLLAEMEAQRLQAGITPHTERVECLSARPQSIELHLAGGKTISARRAIVAIGRSGNFRKLGCPGEDLAKVTNRLHDPRDYAGKQVLVVGGGDSALEAAIALTACGAHTTLSYRKKEFSRPKPDNLAQIQRLSRDPMAEAAVERPTSERITTAASSSMRGDAAPGSLRLALGTEIAAVGPENASLRHPDGSTETIPNDHVFAMIGREAPLEFFRRSGIPIRGEWKPLDFAAMGAFLLFCTWLYHWKGGKEIPFIGKLPPWLNWNPAMLWAWIQSLLPSAADPSTLLGTLKISASGPSFYYTLAYSLIIITFGIRRIRRRKTPYVTAQTLSLTAMQCLPLFLLPEIILPFLGHQGLFDHGWARAVADEFFPAVSYGHGREYWRAYGLVLAWPLFVYNWFTQQPLTGWLIVGFLQTFVLIPLLVWRWGKGAYCGWICSCGALAETLGDQHRHKMPHGPAWNRLNMLGQAILAFAALLMILRILGWAGVSWAAYAFEQGFHHLPVINYAWFVDLLLAGILGYGFYFWYSGRAWCRFACPLAALMHIYARFSRFRIFAEKSKCISCNVCTSVCHQGIDIMNFANKGLPMQDPECVRCSACVQQCPTGVLAFGHLDSEKQPILDRLAASPVRMREASH
ncbi:MAG: NAD(P)-binding domain-containing protein [Candidatus Methylacidiphilales bacterium]|nr:NAD(P)-binding domain-containing protein [Candidatus Methylacidiphilales bacterium]